MGADRLLPLADAEDDAADQAAQIKPEANLEVGWDDVAGADEAKARAAGGRRVPARPEALQRSSAPRCPKGILLHGPPGTGKTLLAKAVAQRVRRAVLLAVGVVVRRDVRRPRRRAHPAPVRRGAQARARRSSSSTRSTPSAASAARTTTPSASRRSTSCSSRWTASARTGDLVVIAASNLLEKLDPALLRPGRFDRQVFVSPPDVHGPRGDPQGPHARQAARARRRPRRARPPDLRA